MDTKKLRFLIPLFMLLALAMPSIASATACTNNWVGGVCTGSITYTTATTLSNDVWANGGVTINSGQVLTSNGFNLYMGGTFNNGGTVYTANNFGGGSGGGGTDFGYPGGGGGYGIYIQAADIVAGTINAYGENTLWQPGGAFSSGGGGGGGTILLAYGTGGYTGGTYNVLGGSPGGGAGNPGSASGGSGGNTIVPGGLGSGIGSNPGTNSIPITVSSANIVTWFGGGFQNYLAGAGGGGGAGQVGNGGKGTDVSNSYGGSGGSGHDDGGEPTAGAGGNGQVATYNYATQPLPTPQQPTTLSITPNPAVYEQPVTVTATCQGTDLCGITTLTNTVLASGTTTASLSLCSPQIASDCLPVGNTIYNGVDFTLGTNTLGTLQVNRDTPIFSLNNCGDQQWLAGGYGCTTTGSFTTQNTLDILNQITANMFLTDQVNGILTLAQIGSTTNAVNTVSDFKANSINTFTYVFNVPQTANTFANSLTVSWNGFAPLYFQTWNGLFTLTPQNTVATAFTATNTIYYPIYLYTHSPSNMIAYGLNEILPTPQLLQSGVSNIGYLPPSNIPNNNVYSVNAIENELGNTVAIGANVFTLNMIDMDGELTQTGNCAAAYQYLESCVVFPFGQNVFTAIPTRWSLTSSLALNQQSNGLTTNYNIANFTTNLPTTYNTMITLNYPFANFSVNLVSNYKVQPTISVNAFQMFIFNGINPFYRNIANFSIFSQETFNSLAGANLSILYKGSVNGYNLSTTAYNTSSFNGLYYLEMTNSIYENPTLSFQLNASIQKPLFFFQSDTFCPTSVTPGSTASYPIGLVDTNGTKYDFYVYTTSGGVSANFLMQIFELKGTGSQQVQSYRLPTTTPFALPLEASGQEYAFDIYSPGCNHLYYEGAFSVPTNPIYILVPSNNSGYVYNTTQASGGCSLISTNAIAYKISCIAGDPAAVVFKYSLAVFNQTSIIGSTESVLNRTFGGASFVYNFTLPSNRTYTYDLYAYAHSNDANLFLLNSGPLATVPVKVAAPLLGFFAFIIMMLMIFGGASTGKISLLILFVDVGMFVVALLQLVVIPTSVMVIFIVMGGLGIWWERPKK